MIFRVQVETLSLLGTSAGLLQWAGLSPAVTTWDILPALVTLFTRCGDFCPKVESRETTQY